MKKLTHYLLTAAIAGVFFSCSENTTERDSEGVKALNATAINKASLASVGISNWMSALQDNVSLSQISVPGTHDSGATVEFPSGTAKHRILLLLNSLVLVFASWISAADTLMILLPYTMDLFIRS